MITKRYNIGLLKFRVQGNRVFSDQDVHCFQLKLLRTEINKTIIDKKNISDKLGNARVVVHGD